MVFTFSQQECLDESDRATIGRKSTKPHGRYRIGTVIWSRWGPEHTGLCGEYISDKSCQFHSDFVCVRGRETATTRQLSGGTDVIPLSNHVVTRLTKEMSVSSWHAALSTPHYSWKESKITLAARFYSGVFVVLQTWRLHNNPKQHWESYWFALSVVHNDLLSGRVQPACCCASKTPNNTRTT